MTKDEFLLPLLEHRQDAVVVTTMGIVRPWGLLSSHELDFASADSAMGHAADLALGIALAQPARKVICLNGDGSMLMCLGTLLTVIQARAANLCLFVVQNGTYEITGNQTVPAAARVDFVKLAQGAGFVHAWRFDEASAYRNRLPDVLGGEGPVFVSVSVKPESEGPISRNPRESAAYLRSSIADSAHRLRLILTCR